MDNCKINIITPDNNNNNDKNNKNNNLQILDFDCLFNGINLFDDEKYFLSKTSIDYLRYIIMNNSDQIYKYILNMYSLNNVCARPYKFTIPIIKKNIDDNLGIVDYEKIKLYLVKNFNKVMDFRKSDIKIRENKKQIEDIDYKLKKLDNDINLNTANNDKIKIDKQIKAIKDQIKKLPGIIISSNGRYEIKGSKNIIDEFNKLFKELKDLNDKRNNITLKNNNIIEPHNKLLQKRNYIVTESNNLVNEISTIRNCCPIIEIIIPNSYLVSNETINKLDKNQIIDLFINFEKDYLVAQIDKCKINTMVILIDLEFFIDDSGQLTKEESGHANSLIIRKNENTFLIVRTEPHRHSNIYCRNSVRKAIKDIFLSLYTSSIPGNSQSNPGNIQSIPANFQSTNVKKIIYLDYIFSSKIGLQIGEDIDEFEDTDYDSLSTSYKLYSPLRQNSGFCNTWSLFYSLLILLNPSLGVEDIGNYLQYLNIPVRIKSVDEIIEEINIKSNDEISNDLNKLVKNNYIQINKSHQDDPLYIITKHRKLYMMIMTVLYILRHIENDNSIIFDDYIISKLEKQYSQIKKYTPRNIKKDNNISNEIIKTIDTNFSNFLNNISNNIEKNINLYTGSLFDKHQKEDNEMSHSNACNKNEIIKHNKEILEENLTKFKKIKPYVPNVLGYMKGGSKNKYTYEKHKDKYLKLKI